LTSASSRSRFCLVYRNFQQRFACVPEYIGAGSFAMGLVFAECVRGAGTLEDDPLRQAAAGLDFNTFHGNFRLDPVTGRQAGHRVRLTQWQQGNRVVLDGPP
jgi:hypothetical protein